MSVTHSKNKIQDKTQGTTQVSGWSLREISQVYDTPLLDLIHQAALVHRKNFDSRRVQLCTLLSVKTGRCPEDCAYCPQSAHYNTFVEPQKLLKLNEVVSSAKVAKKNGATRFCMGAAWKSMGNSPDFDSILQMIHSVSELGLEVCCSMGMLNEKQAVQLKQAGLYAYNHNLDTGEEHYKNIITTRSYQDRLETIKHITKAGISLCCGGILGLGESREDRISLIHTLASLETPPESVPINALVPVEGTPLGDRPRVSIWEMVRMIGTVRIVLPKSMVRLSAGRLFFSGAEQALCFLAGANSIFLGDKLLTTPNNDENQDRQLMDLLSLYDQKSTQRV